MLLDVTPDVSDVSKVNPGVFEKWLQERGIEGKVVSL